MPEGGGCVSNKQLKACKVMNAAYMLFVFSQGLKAKGNSGSRSLSASRQGLRAAACRREQWGYRRGTAAAYWGRKWTACVRYWD